MRLGIINDNNLGKHYSVKKQILLRAIFQKLYCSFFKRRVYKKMTRQETIIMKLYTHVYIELTLIMGRLDIMTTVAMTRSHGDEVHNVHKRHEQREVSFLVNCRRNNTVSKILHVREISFLHGITLSQQIIII